MRRVPSCDSLVQALPKLHQSNVRKQASVLETEDKKAEDLQNHEKYSFYLSSSCNTCRKKYKAFKRYKHHCSRCLATFCHKHGRTTHSNFTSCRVPGDCICNSCLRQRGIPTEGSKHPSG